MRAYRILDWLQAPELVEVADPEPGPGQVVVRVAGNGLCHSDAMMSQMPGEIGELLGWRVPFTLGHEVAGWVAAVGDGVTAVAEGDPVALVSAASCGVCEMCVRGRDNACLHNDAGRGYGRDGGLAELVLVDSVRSVIPLRTLDPKVAGPLTDAGATAYHAVKRVLPTLVPGSTALVVGAGGLGAFAVQLLAALSPATILAVDANAARLEYVRTLGAHDAFGGVDKGTPRAVLERTAGRGADAVLDFVGIDATIDVGLASLRRTGSFALVGAGGGRSTKPWYGTFPQEAEIFTFQGGTIADAHEVVALAEAGRIRSDIDEFPLDRVAEAYEALEAGALTGRAVVVP
jgi:propanol-preferring alcohol dehydrogenase